MQNNQILFSVMKILNILEAMNKIKLFNDIILSILYH